MAMISDVAESVELILSKGFTHLVFHTVSDRCALDWVDQPRDHHNHDLLILVNSGLSGSMQPVTWLPGVPQLGSRIYMVDVSICTQADLDCHYAKNLGQRRWLQDYVQSCLILDIHVCVFPILVAMTSKVHRNFFTDMEALGVDWERAKLLVNE